MKRIIVLRDGDWDYAVHTLTDKAKARCGQLKKRLEKCDLVISSPRPRAIETAQLLTGLLPAIDARAGVLALTEDQHKFLLTRSKTHPFGMAGIFFDTPELIRPLKILGKNFVALMRETLEKLPADGQALIVTHDGTIVAGEKVLLHAPFETLKKSYQPLRATSLMNTS